MEENKDKKNKLVGRVSVNIEKYDDDSMVLTYSINGIIYYRDIDKQVKQLLTDIEPGNKLLSLRNKI